MMKAGEPSGGPLFSVDAARTLVATNDRGLESALGAIGQQGGLFPLPQQCAADGGLLRWQLSLPEELLLQLNQVVPSFCSLAGVDYSFQCVFDGSSGSGRSSAAALSPVGALPPPARLASILAVTEHVAAEIDTFFVKQPLSRAAVTVLVWSPDPARILDSPWIISLACKSGSQLPVAVPRGLPRRALDVPPKSQMSVDKIGPRICSPTCVAMLAEYYGRRIDPEQAAAAAYCAEHDLFGVWPWNIHAASRFGIPGFIAAFDSWDQAQVLLDRKLPLIVSIRYAKGELTGAAQERRDERPLGHLVVLRGYEQDKVLVHDPAARSAAGVPRAYDLQQFLRVWLTRSAIGYVLLPPAG